MPGDMSPRDGILHALAVRAICLLQIAVQQPRAGSPYEFRALGNRDGLRIKLRKVSLNDRRLCIDKPHIQMAFEHHQYLLDTLIRGKPSPGKPVKKFTP